MFSSFHLLTGIHDSLFECKTQYFTAKYLYTCLLGRGLHIYVT